MKSIVQELCQVPCPCISCCRKIFDSWMQRNSGSQVLSIREHQRSKGLSEEPFPMNTTMTAVRDFGEATWTSLVAAMALFFAAIPKVLGFLVILIVGWIVAAILARAIAAVLRRIQFDRLAAQSGFSGFVRNAGMDTDASGAIAFTVKWFVRLIALVVAFDALGLPAVSD